MDPRSLTKAVFRTKHRSEHVGQERAEPHMSPKSSAQPTRGFTRGTERSSEPSPPPHPPRHETQAIGGHAPRNSSAAARPAGRGLAKSGMPIGSLRRLCDPHAHGVRVSLHPRHLCLSSFNSRKTSGAGRRRLLAGSGGASWQAPSSFRSFRSREPHHLHHHGQHLRLPTPVLLSYMPLIPS